MELISRELRTYLEGVLVKDVVKIIEEYVVGQAKRIVNLLRVIESISWGCSEKGVFEDEDFVGTIRVDDQKIYYKFGVVRSVYRCRNCGTVQNVAFYDMRSEAMIRHIEYWDCGDICGDGTLFVDEDGGTAKIKIEENSINFEFFVK
ncbi:hypothetical protein BNJ_00461 [Kaumoebavirus]|uniref:hypothetical protein n=1 Tax=Kaumoebavirus TaxID=1859492 RepID=UPI0009C1F794|nr:hypothetical protein BNJ_00461 [Kaumoebavirus]ARA72273.1 hypothetical protein BNJ_00461 [Kaumoebavirus]